MISDARTSWDDGFLLGDDTARALFGAIRDLPIVDYHSHLDAGLLAANRPAANLPRLWLADGRTGDHYKWRL